MNRETAHLLMLATGALFVIGTCVIIYLIIRAIWRAIKRFTFEIIDRTNGAASRKPDYRGEARKACEKVTPKQDKNATPPWEE